MKTLHPPKCSPLFFLAQKAIFYYNNVNGWIVAFHPLKFVEFFKKMLDFVTNV